MNNPYYILRTVESIKVVKNPLWNKLRKIVAIICAVLAVGSFLLGDNLFGALSFVPKLLLLGLIIGCFFGGKKENRSFPIEIYFFNDRIEICRKEVHYSNGKIKREFYRFFYAHNPHIKYDHRNRYITIRGMAHGEWYLYSKDGRICPKPDRVRDTEGICYFYVADNKLDIVREIENHSPIKVEIVNV